MLQHLEVHGVHCLGVAGVEVVKLLLVLQHAGVGIAELGLVKGFAELLPCLLHLLVYFVLVLRHLLFYEHVGAVTLLGVAIINEWVVESVHVTGCLPYCGVHEYGGVYADDVVVQQYH